MVRTSVLVGLVFALGASKYTGAVPGSYCDNVPKEHRVNPFAYAMPALGGGTMAITNEAGVPTIIDFYASWCGACVYEMEDFVDITKRYTDRHLQVLLVDVGEEPKDAQRFVSDNRITYPVALDQNFALGTELGIVQIPTTAFYNAKGVLTCLSEDMLTTKELDNEVAAAVDGWMP